MAFTQTILKVGVIGDMSYEIVDWVATDVTSGNIDSAIKSITHVGFTNKTTPRGVLDWTTVAGRVAITGVTSGDTGTVMIFGPAGY